jgi:hypothetical protein
MLLTGLEILTKESAKSMTLPRSSKIAYSKLFIVVVVDDAAVRMSGIAPKSTEALSTSSMNAKCCECLSAQIWFG